MLFTADGMENYISGVIMFDETLRQATTCDDKIPFVKLLSDKDVLPGIKVDTGAKTLANSSIGAEACSDNLTTIVLQAANAGAIFTALKNNWEFHGTIAATTPTGSRNVIVHMSGLSIGSVSPVILSARPPY